VRFSFSFNYFYCSGINQIFGFWQLKAYEISCVYFACHKIDWVNCSIKCSLRTLETQHQPRTTIEIWCQLCVAICVPTGQWPCSASAWPASWCSAWPTECWCTPPMQTATPLFPRQFTFFLLLPFKILAFALFWPLERQKGGELAKLQSRLWVLRRLPSLFSLDAHLKRNFFN
jgi:hypothetical protein